MGIIQSTMLCRCGIKRHFPIEAGSWLSEVADLSDRSLGIILKELYDSTLEGFDSIEEIVNEPIEYAPLISGGYLFVVNGTIMSRPGCCSGLETIIEWEEAIESSTKTGVWTGHDKEGIIHIEGGNPQLKVWVDEKIFWLKKNDYCEAVKKTAQIIDVFIEKAAILLNELLNIKTGKTLAKAMIYK